ncbi:MAG: DUF58 domain-containing protein [Actinomycetaceae bacterium]|nr:DUF58 domain-containing protein [Actinomycetaceae bacterium]
MPDTRLEVTTRSVTARTGGTTSVPSDSLSVGGRRTFRQRLQASWAFLRNDASKSVAHSYSRASQWFKEHVTVPGRLAILVALVCTPFGVAFGIGEWILPGLAAFFLLVLSSFFLFGGNNYDVDLGILQDHVTAGEGVTASITVTNTGKTPLLPGTLEIPIGEAIAEAGVPFLLPRGKNKQELDIPARKRGVIEVGPVRSIRADPVGLLHRDLQWTDKHTLYVHPRTVMLPSMAQGFIRDLEGTPSNHLVNDDISFHAIREYVNGDSMHSIHWKTTAKTGQLMVRQFEETRRSLVGVLLSLNDGEYRDEEEFELGVSAAASLALRLIRDNQDLDVIVSDEIPEGARDVAKSARRVFTTGGLVGTLNEFTLLGHSEMMMPLDDVALVAATGIDFLSNVFMVAGSSVELSELQVSARRFSPDTAVTVIRVDVESQPRVQQIQDMNVFTLGTLDDLQHLMLRLVQA